MRGPRYPLTLLAITAVLLAVSAYQPYEMATWWMEVAPVIVAVPILLATYRRFPLTPLAYTLIFVHACILILGGHYTYARVPLGFWVQDLFEFCAQSLRSARPPRAGLHPGDDRARDPAAPHAARRGGWLFFIVCCVCLAISACYEFIEWWAALIGGAGATEFLGTQGDVWDTQWDMFMALIGSIVSAAHAVRACTTQAARLGSEP